MNKEDIKNNMIPDEIKDICRSCESNIFAQNKGCAFRSLGNEYCDYVLEATKIYLDKQQELERYKNIIDEFDKWLVLQRDNLDKRVSEMKSDDKNMTRANHYTFIYNRILDKLKKLKGSDE